MSTEASRVGAEDNEGLLETLEILSDQDLVKRLAIAEGKVERGETIGLDELRQQIRSGTFRAE